MVHFDVWLKLIEQHFFIFDRMELNCPPVIFELTHMLSPKYMASLFRLAVQGADVTTLDRVGEGRLGAHCRNTANQVHPLPTFTPLLPAELASCMSYVPTGRLSDSPVI